MSSKKTPFHPEEDVGAGVINEKVLEQLLGLVDETDDDVRELEKALKGKRYVEIETKMKFKELKEVME